jgi:hypothetical protein
MTEADSAKAARQCFSKTTRRSARGRIEMTNWRRFSADETFDIGEDTGSPSALIILPHIASPERSIVLIDIRHAKLSADDNQKIHETDCRLKLAVE